MNRQRIQRDRIDGVLLIDKPAGLSSNDALMRVRRLLNARKAGHGGTLDPMASGLLPVVFGEATKFAGDALGADKTYDAQVTLGRVTDTGDAEGRLIREARSEIGAEALEVALRAFVGKIAQIPPMHSALKRDGKPLYEYARAGVTLEREAREVTIHAIDLLAFERVPDTEPGAPGSQRIRLRVACSKGTYIRTLAEDLGERLGCGAHLSALRRERVGVLDIAQAIGLDRLEALEPAGRIARVAPVDSLLTGLQRAELDDNHARRFLHGQRLRVDASETHAAPARATRVRVYCRGELLGVATLEDGVLVPARLVDSSTRPGDAPGSFIANGPGS